MGATLLIGLLVTATGNADSFAAPTPPAISYRVVDDGGSKRLGPIKSILIESKLRNERDLRRLAEQLRQEFKRVPRASALVYDDEYAASLYRTLSLQPKDREHRDKHWIGHYSKDSKSEWMRIMLKGFNGPVIEVKFGAS